jgi:NDP-sugar pyrophosphorylase family protein
MNPNPIIANESDTIEYIESLIKENRILSIPVVDRNGKFIDLKAFEHIIKKNKLENPVVIMAGGFGKRLLPLTKNTPKPMLKVGATPILESIIKRFKDYGFYKFFISTHYKAEVIKEYLGSGSKWNVNIEYIEENQPLGTAGALSLLPDDLNDIPVVIMNGDLITEINFESLIMHHIESGDEVTVSVVEYDMEVPYGVIKIENNKVKDLEEKPVHKFFVNAGIYVLNANVISELEKNAHIDMTQLLNRRILEKKTINIFPLYENWIDIGNEADFESINKSKNKD